MSILWVILGLILLVVGGDFLVKASIALSFKLNLSKMVIGMTVVSFATSAPELLVSLQAALRDAPAIAINNVVGSNIANIGLVLGVTAIIGPIAVDKSFYKLNWPVMLFFSFMLYYFLINDNMLSSTEGLILFCSLIVFIIVLIKNSKSNIETTSDVKDVLATVANYKILMWLLIGAAALYFGSVWLVNGAKNLAEAVGVSDAVIAVTVIAIGTSVPELAASIIAAAKKEKALSLGNLIGSNIFNIGSVLGLTSIIKSIPVTDVKILGSDIFWMIGFSAILLILILIPKIMQISRYKGLLLVLGYCLFLYFSFK